MPDDDFHNGTISIERRAGKDVLVVGDLVRALTPEEVRRITWQGHERLAAYAMTLRETIVDEVWEKLTASAPSSRSPHA